MKKQNSLVKTHLYSMTAVILILVSVIAYVWANRAYMEFRNTTARIQKEYISSKKSLIKTEVEKVVDYVLYKKSIAEKRLKEDVKARTYEAHNMASYIYDKNKHTKHQDEIKRLIHDAFYSVSWDNGRGYYFVEDMKGTELINPNNPELEGKNILHIKDSKGNYIMETILSTIKSGGEGFCSYYWNKPDNPDIHVPKISYVKYFEPFDWIIGNGKYLATEEKKIMDEILSRIENISYGTNRYVFAGQWDGKSLSGPSKGKNMLNITDSNGVKIVEGLIEKAKNGGGFVSYVMPRLEDHRPAPKISYAQGIPDWKWYIGTGIYVDEIEALIKQNQMELNKRIKIRIYHSIYAIFFLLIFSFILTRFISKKIKKNLDVFGGFFDRASTQNMRIDLKKIHFNEFKQLGESANQMIKERERVRKALEESEKRFHKVIDVAHIPMAITNISGSIEFVNKIFVDTFGYTLDDIPTLTHWFHLAYPDEEYRHIVKAAWDHAMTSSPQNAHPIKNKSWKVTCKNGTVRDVEFNYSTVGNRGLTTFRDLTEQKKAGKEKEALEKQLFQAQKMEAIGLMAGGVAHDLNNILTGIVSYPELILMKLPKDSIIRKHVLTIQESGKQAAEVVSDLLTVARGVASTKSTENLNTIIMEYLDSPEYRMITTRHGSITVTTRLDTELFNIFCSKVHIKKCLMNLIINGAEAINNKGQIVISTRNIYLEESETSAPYLKAGEYAVLTVKDTGEGISDEDISRIFEPFYTRKKMGKSGTGLGLAVVWNSIQDHKGGIKVQSSVKGTAFELYFPITRDKIKISRDEFNMDDLKGCGEIILVVDDEPRQQEIATQLLEVLGYNAVSVSSGEEAVEYLKSNTVDLLLLDMIMAPGMNGRETYEQIIRLHPDQKAVIASGFSKTSDVKALLKKRAGRYIRKPYMLNDLALAVKKTLNGD